MAVSAVLIADMKQRRQKDYVFSWNKALQVYATYFSFFRICNVYCICTGIRIIYIVTAIIILLCRCHFLFYVEPNSATLPQYTQSSHLHTVVTLQFQCLLLECTEVV